MFIFSLFITIIVCFALLLAVVVVRKLPDLVRMREGTSSVDYISEKALVIYGHTCILLMFLMQVGIIALIVSRII